MSDDSYVEKTTALKDGVTLRQVTDTVPQDSGDSRTTVHSTYELPLYKPAPGPSASWVSPVQSISVIKESRKAVGGYSGSEKQPDRLTETNYVRVNFPDATQQREILVSELVARQMRDAFPGVDVVIDPSGVRVSQSTKDGNILAPQALGKLLSDMQAADLISAPAAKEVAAQTGAADALALSTRMREEGQPPAFTGALETLRAKQGGKAGHEDFATEYTSRTIPSVNLLGAEARSRVGAPQSLRDRAAAANAEGRSGGR